jgi:hypothetical protein
MSTTTSPLASKLAIATNHFDTCIKKHADDMPKSVCINTHCPWSQKEVSEDSMTTYKTFVVGFCNPQCRDTFALAVEAAGVANGDSKLLLEVPRFDKNEYDQVLLPNGILATLVSDSSLQR